MFLRLDNSRQPPAQKTWNILGTIYLIHESNTSIKSLDFSPSVHVKHIILILLLMTGEFMNLYFHFYFLNMDISLNNKDANLKF